MEASIWEGEEDEDEDEDEEDEGEEDGDGENEEEVDEGEEDEDKGEEDKDEGEEYEDEDEDEDPLKNEDVEEFMDCFKQMTQLRSILFTYDPDIFNRDTYREEPELEPEVFASNFFQYLDARGWCPSLDVLVTGVPVDLEDIEDVEPGYAHALEFKTPHPWHCFVKGQYECVPAHVLRSHQPGYNMPDIIPRAHWMDSTAGESWGFLADRKI
ncbi:hypothetical protein J4E80_006354 [Alternaria sp. BMP 0032]|nr:hypothetical protein J4E80_006354 [Alternaria sp. BMP 0032]